MLRVRVCDDRDECRAVWARAWPRASLFDLWEVRACFDEAFDRPPYFLVAERDGAQVGVLALSRLAETGELAQFPGETWQGRTWLEGNRVPARDPAALRALIEAAPAGTEVRYLLPEALAGGASAALDEIGYLFHRPATEDPFASYLALFSGKSRKRLGRELEGLAAQGLAFRHDHLPDVEQLVRLNRDGFGARSFFADPRFLGGFERLVAWLRARGALRVTTALIGGAVAAVDVGATWGADHWVFAGGTDPAFPGIAKAINFHHVEWACAARLDSVDFLCGDFGWKSRFHLTPRPLYCLTLPGAPRPVTVGHPAAAATVSASTAVAC